MTTAERLRNLGKNWPSDSAHYTAMTKAADELEALQMDKARLDWLESKSNLSGWIARESTTGRGYRLTNTTEESLNVRDTAREAIDAAMKGSK